MWATYRNHLFGPVKFDINTHGSEEPFEIDILNKDMN